MRVGQQKGSRVAIGVVKVTGRRRVVVEFDDEQFEAIRLRAISAGTSFPEEVRLLCEWGIEGAMP